MKLAWNPRWRIQCALIFSFCVVFAFGDLGAQTNVWQPSVGHTQIPIWPGSAPDAEAVPGPENYTATTKLIASEWRKVFEANRGTLKDANTVRAGTKLIIPE